MIAFIYPLLDVFLTLVWIFLFILWVWLVISVVLDVFASHDLSGPAKAAWVAVVFFFPVIGALVYLMVRGTKMAAHQRSAVPGQSYADWFDKGFDRTGRRSVADEVEKLAALKDRGLITDEEFNTQKRRLVAD